MDWIFYSAVMFVGSVVYYLLVKKVQDLGVDRYLYMATTSIVPAIAYALIGLIDGQSFIMSPLGFLIIFINAAFLNYFGSITGFIGIKTAPNAGYSVIIQKSYAIYTSILAVFLFDSELPFYKVLAILIILFFTGLIVIERSNEKFKIGKWVVYSFIAFLLFGGTTIAAKYAAKIGEDPNIFLFWVMLVTASISIVEALRNKSKITIKLNTKIIIWLFLMSASRFSTGAKIYLR